ncbi:DEAH-box RNA helicase prp16 [Podila epigama]|nr:DEAH-box RNA helicase prp16 [Podila epigama]
MSGLEHQIAIDISRALNLVNANDLLARQVIQIARNHKQVQGFVKACAAFGKFKEEFLFDIYQKILDHDQEFGVEDSTAATKQKENEKNVSTTKPKKDPKEPTVGMSNFTLSFTEEDEELPPQLPGGLLKKAKPSGDNAPVFKVPTAPRGVSRLGLDKLALEKREERKRAAKAALQSDAKRSGGHRDASQGDQDVKMDDASDSDKRDKGTDDNHTKDGKGLRVLEPRYRNKGMETPSHPGGVKPEEACTIELKTVAIEIMIKTVVIAEIDMAEEVIHGTTDPGMIMVEIGTGKGTGTGIEIETGIGIGIGIAMARMIGTTEMTDPEIVGTRETTEMAEGGLQTDVKIAPERVPLHDEVTL